MTLWVFYCGTLISSILWIISLKVASQTEQDYFSNMKTVPMFFTTVLVTITWIPMFVFIFCTLSDFIKFLKNGKKAK